MGKLFMSLSLCATAFCGKRRVLSGSWSQKVWGNASQYQTPPDDGKDLHGKPWHLFLQGDTMLYHITAVCQGGVLQS